MGAGCSNWFTPRGICPGYENWKPSKRCAVCGYSTIMLMNSRPIQATWHIRSIKTVFVPLSFGFMVTYFERMCQVATTREVIQDVPSSQYSGAQASFCWAAQQRGDQRVPEPSCGEVVAS